jgi:hypothetical protein
VGGVPAALETPSLGAALVEHVLTPAADAFLEVGVFVGPLLLLFGWAQRRTRGRLVAWVAGRRHAGPLLGAALGAMPGCGGAIVLMPLWSRGQVSFGTIVAALVATMGDSSFVLIAADPVLALGVHGLLLVTGAVVGVAVDAFGIAPRARATGAAPVPPVPALPTGLHRITGLPRLAALPRPLPPAAAAALSASSLAAYWVLVAAGLLVGVPVLAGITDGAALATHLGGIDPTLVVGGLGMALTVGLLAAARVGRRRAATCPIDAMGPSLPATAEGGDPSDAEGSAVGAAGGSLLRDSARETAFVTVWVAIAFVVTSLVVAVADVPLLAGEGGAALSGGAGLLAVLAAAAIGLIPGCGPQIVLTGLYVQGALPLSVLAANALSQDGDALIPLLASDRRAALLGTAISVVPGVAVGGLLLALGR